MGLRGSWMLGVLLAAVSVTAFASTFVVGASLTKAHGVAPEVLAFVRFVVAGAVMFAVQGVTSEGRRRLFAATPREWLLFATLGPVGTSLMAWCVFKGCSLVSTANASMADALAPLLMFALAAWSARRITFLQTVGALCGFVGALFVIGIVHAHGVALSAYSRGDVYVFFAAATWAAYSVYGRRTIQRLGADTFTCWTMFFGALLFAFVLPWGDFAWPTTARAWGLTVLLGLACTLLPFWTWNAAQKYIPVSTLGVSAYFTPVVSVALAVLFLDERVTFLQGLGTLFVCASAMVESEKVKKLKGEKAKG